MDTTGGPTTMGTRRGNLSVVKGDNDDNTTPVKSNLYEVLLVDTSGNMYVFECNELGINPEVSPDLVFFYQYGVASPVFTINVASLHSWQQRIKGDPWPVRDVNIAAVLRELSQPD